MLDGVGERFVGFVKNYSEHFKSHRHDVFEKAQQYACGLMQGGSRKNMDRMAEVVPDSNSRNLQQFLTHSKWDSRAVIDDVASDANELIGNNNRTGLIIDETSFKKQGNKSVGTARQWLGRFGKVDNGQVAVFGVLSKNALVTPTDTRLYLPKSWTDNPYRCDEAGIPEEFREFKTKDQLALDIVTHARNNGLQYGWVGADAGYGKGPGFCRTLQEMGERFIVDVHSDFRVYLQDPQPYVPCKAPGPGRKPTKYRTDAENHKVSDVIVAAGLSDQSIIRLRETSRGSLAVRAVRVPVYIWDGDSDTVFQWDLVATQTISKNPETKISICNLPSFFSLKGLAWRQRQRYWVERSFQDAKSECGMADYQVRKWSAWHHHMTLVMMAMLFMVNEKILSHDERPMLTCADIEELLAHFLPRRDVGKQEVIRQLEYRHKMRKKAKERHTETTEQTIRLERAMDLFP